MTDNSALHLPKFAIYLYALAWAGGAIAYTPFLTILLPVHIDGLVSRATGEGWLAYIVFAGAIAASFAGIAFGYLSDLSGNRKLWIASGLALSCVFLAYMKNAADFTSLLVFTILWQCALNMMLAPLAAWAADNVPDRSKGMLGGLMAFAPGFGALSGAIVTLPQLGGTNLRFEIVAILVVCCVIPFLLMPNTQMRPSPPPISSHVSVRPAQSHAKRMWFARLCVQIAEATLFAYLFFWLTSMDRGITDNDTAKLFSVIMVISAPLALYFGAWSDRNQKPIVPLHYAAAVAALGLFAMASAQSVMVAVLAYGVFGLAGSVFLALHSAQTLRILPNPQRRGRDLGVFNLSNTIPSLVMPWLTLSLVPIFGYKALLWVLALLSLLAAWLLAPRHFA